MSKIIPFERLSELKRSSVCRNGIIHCHGVFDILHAGHLAYFKSAKAFKPNAALVVTLTSDRYVNKGPGKPIFPAETRAEMLAALKLVDFVAISDYPTAVPAIERLKPTFYVKGPDYRDKTKDLTGEIYNEEIACEGNGGKVVFTDDQTFSSSALANRFFVTWTDDQQKIIDHVKGLGGMDLIIQCLDKMSSLRVLTVGEPIVDTYRFCEPQNISSKSPSISAKFLFEETYHGGAWAIRNHMADFVSQAVLFIPPGFKIPEKIRYIAHDKSQRIFEITHIKDDHWVNENPDPFIDVMVKDSQTADLVVLADFGHGLFEGKLLAGCKQIKSMVALNVQTNSSNYGFNPYTKHSRFDYLSLDTRELRVAFHDRQSSPIQMLRRCRNEAKANVSLTCGPNGAYFNDHFSPAFADQVIDATGAGDAYFAMTSLLVKVGAPPSIVPFLGNVFAGLKTKIIGNKQSVTKVQFLKALQGILK